MNVGLVSIKHTFQNLEKSYHPQTFE